MAQATDAPVMEVRGLDFSWPGIALFRKLDLRLPPGVSVVCGEESSGKTTLLRLLSGDLQANGARLALSNSTPEATATQLHSKVFRTEPRSDALDAISATTWFESLPSRYPTFDVALAHGLAHGFALEPHIDKPMYMLSAGSKRKVWLCAAFAAGTPLTLIDEPFAALDTASIRFLRGLLEEASSHHDRAWVLADHTPPEGLVLRTQLVLSTPD
ncbi:MAG: ATP-binding cassette domain-containing protein [Hydrogenophaga sp.]|uniref:ABC transporter ATP-binding protein n=1 Tax=Hydrogenophaga sp. TaxID=1904254 RepID=UPI002735A17E|nr:ATP-binding cassette domain-containing protein [Hydrogenophaga sp.]MDP3351279.1 ATP-binding cassette domain-containing protein [Hydrogenophaga sp.]MDZ4283480.1 ATP-binding cassette domain-containing protein [Hydrogenophaga sp.]